VKAPVMALRRTGAVVVFTAGLALSGCASAPAPHAVHSNPAPSGGGVAPTLLDARTLSQVDSELGAVHRDLTRADTDLNNPTPDS